MISCPACAGVVRAESGPHGHLEFVCSVGHAFSLEDLYQAKEEQVEEAQWSVVALLKHVQMIGGMLLDSDRSRKVFTLEDLRHRLKQAADHITLIERTIHETQWPSSSRQGANFVRQGQDE
jgi:hypothetical protein